MNIVRNILTKVKKLILNQEGSVLVIVAVMMIVLIGFSAILVDAGEMYRTRRQMVTAADAAALAGARELKLSSGNVDLAKQKAEEYAVLNGADSCVVQPILPPSSTTIQVVDVTVHKNVEFTFAKALGFLKPKDIAATAVATWGYRTEANLIFPFYYEGDTAPTPGPATLHTHIIKKNNGDDEVQNSSSWGIFDLQTHSDMDGKKLNTQDSWNILSGKETIFTPSIDIDNPLTNTATADEWATPGAIQSMVDALDKESTEWDSMGRLYKYHLVTYHSYKNSISLFGLVPVVTVLGEGPNAELKVNGFAVYEIQDIIVSKTGNENLGSEYSTFALNTHEAINYKNKVNESTGEYYDKGTIIGRFVEDGWVDTPIGGNSVVQITDDPNAAKYLRLIQ